MITKKVNQKKQAETLAKEQARKQLIIEAARLGVFIHKDALEELKRH